MANNIDLTISALECPLGTFQCSGRLIFRFRTDPPSVRRCSARLIRQAETLELQPRSRPPSSHTMAFAPKRSTSRFAPLTLRCRTEMFFQNIPVLRSAYFPKKLFSFFSKTLDLQVRCAHPTGIFAPKRLFKPFRCSAWLIPYRQRTALSVGKRTCFRFAALTLRVQGGRRATPQALRGDERFFQEQDR